MLDAGCLMRLIAIIRQKSKDTALRRAGALCLRRLLDFDAIEATGASRGADARHAWSFLVDTP